MQFVPGEWLSDARVSQCRPATRGIWIDALSAMHGIDRCGQLSGTVEALARVCRCRVDEMRAAVDDLRSTGAADVTESNNIVTLVNRRMRREYENRQAVKNRVDSHRQNKRNANATRLVTLLSRRCNATLLIFQKLLLDQSTLEGRPTRWGKYSRIAGIYMTFKGMYGSAWRIGMDPIHQARGARLRAQGG